MPSARFALLLAIPIALLATADPDAVLRQAQADLNAGRYAAAIENGVEASQIFRRAGNLSKTARAITISGLGHMYSGAYDPALRSFEEARQLSEQASDLDYQVTCLNNIGTVLYFEGRYSDAMQSYHDALEHVSAIQDTKARASRHQLTVANTAILYQTLGQYERALTLYGELLNAPQALPPPEQAQLLANVGVLRRRLGDPAKALLTYRSAQAWYQKSGLLDGEIAVLNNIGIVQAMDMAELQGAAATFTASLALAEKSGNRPLAVQAHLYRGETFLRSGDLSRANADFGAAAEGATSLGEREEQWKAEYGLANVALRHNDPAKGMKLLRHAIQTVEAMRGSLNSPSLRSAFLADKRRVYDLLIQNTSDAEEVFHAMEQSRARGLKDSVAPGNPVSIRSLSASLPPDSAILEYWLGESSAAVLWISASGSSLKRWPVSPIDGDNIDAVRAAMADPKRERAGAATHLAAQLLGGVAPLRDPGIRRIIVVPDGPLGQIPFEALPFGEGLLIDRFTVSYAPSAALVPGKPRSRAVRWFWQPGIEAFADPAPGSASAGDLVNESRYSRLPEASREIHSIASEIGGRAILREGPEARKSAMMHLSGAPALHLATHAFADVENPDLSYILFAPSAPAQRFDYLFQKEIGQLSLSGVDLLTLSACETAVGKMVPGEGTQSLSRAFLASGVPSVVTSLWNVGDKATADLMIRFYARLASGKTVEESLREAKLDFLHSSQASHPAYWAAFIVSGDGSVRLPYVVGWKWFVLPLVLAAIALVLRVRLRKKAGMA